MGTAAVEAKREEVLGFEAWAALSARLLRRSEGERADLLKAAGVTPESWASADARFGKELAGELAAGDTVRARRYGALCAAELSGRGRVAGPATASASSVAAKAAVLPAAAATPLPPPVVVQTATPSYARGGDLDAASEESSPFSVATHSAPPPSFMQSPPPAAASFTPLPAVSLPASSPSSQPYRNPGPALHDPDAEPPSTRTLSFAAAGPPSVPLPFHARPSAGFQSYLASAPNPHARHDGDTLAAALPVPPLIDRTPELTVEQYAALCVAYAMFPDRTRAVWQQFGIIDEAAHRELNGEWRQRLGDDTPLQNRWMALCEHYRAYYANWPGARS